MNDTLINGIIFGAPLAAGIVLITLAFTVGTTNTASTMLFKVVPFFVGQLSIFASVLIWVNVL